MAAVLNELEPVFSNKDGFCRVIRRKIKFQGQFVILLRLYIRNFRLKFGENPRHFGNVITTFLLVVESKSKNL